MHQARCSDRPAVEKEISHPEDSGNLLTEAGIRSFLSDSSLQIRCFETIGSTNTELKALAEAGAPEGTALVASAQTAGRGRMGRSFYSPPGSGLYLSLLLRPRIPAQEASLLTACAAVAAAEAIEAVSGQPAKIKWVNDILIAGRKVCGILSESSLNPKSGMLDYAVIGVGINVTAPEGGFPEELQDIAGALFPAERKPDDTFRCRLAASLLEKLIAGCAHPASESTYHAYCRRSIIPGRKVLLLSPGRSPVRADALGISRDYGLIVRYEDGTESTVNSGEVSVRPAAGFQ